MIFVFLDEFGHNGPFVARNDPRYNTSPVFGLAGYLMPQDRIRSFATCFLKIKEKYLSQDPTRGGKPYHEWEKKGTNFFTEKSITKYPAIKQCGFRTLNEISQRGGHIFYQGREKIRGNGEGLNPNGLYKTIFSDVIRKIDAYCETINKNFVIVLDENTVRKELLVTAAKTMFGENPTRRMISPPFEVESHLNQNMQAADWIATIIGRLWNYQLAPDDYPECGKYNALFWRRIHDKATHSTVMKRSKPGIKNLQTMGNLGERMIDSGIIRRTIDE